MLDQFRGGDTVVVWKLARLSRSLKDVLHIMETIADAGAGFRSLTEKIDTTTPAGRMMMLPGVPSLVGRCGLVCRNTAMWHACRPSARSFSPARVAWAATASRISCQVVTGWPKERVTAMPLRVAARAGGMQDTPRSSACTLAPTTVSRSRTRRAPIVTKSATVTMPSRCSLSTMRPPMPQTSATGSRA